MALDNVRPWAVAALVLAGLCLVVGERPARADAFNLLHSFSGGAGDGLSPQYGSLALSGTTLYGMTMMGGAGNQGVVFKMDTDGSGYANLHAFAGGAGDGSRPYASVTLDGGTLYGMTYQGGANAKGVIFKVNTDGTGYTNLHEFAGGAGDGALPRSSLTLDGTTLYGMTYNGGADDHGVVFKMETNGTGYANLHEFAGGAGDGKNAHGDLTVDGSTLYGTTRFGGASDGGVIFKMNTNGTGYTNLREFAGGAGDGLSAFGGLTLDGSTLYGMTSGGGASNRGVVFEVQDDGTGYANLHEFAGGAGDGWGPYGSLTQDGATLYGMTFAGGASNEGVIFEMATDGTGYANLREFTATVDDGEAPGGSLVLDGTMLYGMTDMGGASDRGIVFCQSAVPEPSTIVLALMAGAAGVGLRRRRRKRR